ncbi:MAG: porin family protein [Myxococcales bacterium]|nr:porin family protein [Myxococcales bacterium]
MKNISALALGSVILLLGALPARATDNEYTREGAYLGLGGFYALQNASGVWSPSGDTGGLGFMVGYRMVPQMSWELGGSWLDEFTLITGEDVAVGTVTVAVKLYLAELFDGALLGGRLQPYVIGNGGIIVGTPASKEQIGGAFGGGLGTEYYVTPNWALNANIQYNANRGAFDGIGYVGFTLGALYRF